jgi:ketosteroid isomerase-like protein
MTVGRPPGSERMLDRAQAEAWIAGYERAWRTAGTDALNGLFTEDATYRLSPFELPIVGLPAIAQIWEAERRGPDERFTLTSEIVAVERGVAVARVEVRYEDLPREYRDLWIIRFASDGRCQAFEEWPFWPGQPRSAPGAA